MRLQVASAASTATAVAASLGWAVTARRLGRRTAAWRRMCQDPVTGLWTRAAWQEAVRDRLSDWPVLGLLDLDGFKQLNDTAGHHTGDAVLRAVAQELTRALPAQGIAGRYGGDELVFAAALTMADLQVVHRRLTRAATQTAGPALAVGISLGSVRVPAHAELEDALARADAQMYRAKRAGAGWRAGWCVVEHPSPSSGGCLPWQRRHTAGSGSAAEIHPT